MKNPWPHHLTVHKKFYRNWKNNCFVASRRNFLKVAQPRFETHCFLSNDSFKQIFMVSSRGMLINNEAKGVFSHFDSFIPRSYRFNLVSTLIFRCYSICCSMELFHIEIMHLNEIFEKNGHDNKFFDRCLQTYLNKIYSKKFH